MAAFARYEHILAAAPAGFGPRLAEAARRARARLAGSVRPGLLDAAVGVVGPVLAAWLLWIADTALRSGGKRLYFVARDGAILTVMYAPLAAKLNLNLTGSYLYGSRQVFGLAAVRTREAAVRPLTHPPMGTSARWAFARAGLYGDAAADLAARVPDADAPLTAEGRAALAALAEDDAVAARLLDTAARLRGRTLAYLADAGLIEPGAVYVDPGWFGRVHEALCSIVASGGGPAPSGLFFGLDGPAADPDTRAAMRAAYAYDRRTGYTLDVPSPYLMIEMWCRAEHGPVLDFAGGPLGMHPVCEPAVDDAYVRFGVRHIHAAAVAFAAELDLRPSDPARADALRPTIAALCDAFWRTPTPEEARAWGAYPVRSDPLDAHTSTLAAPYGVGEVFWALARGRRPERHPNEWVQGSFAASGPIVRALGSAAGVLAGLRRR